MSPTRTTVIKEKDVACAVNFREGLASLLSLSQQQDFGGLDLKAAAADADIVAQTIRSHPDEFQSLLEAAWAGSPASHTMLEELGLTEPQVQAKGGGMLWLIVALVLLYSTNAY